MFGRKKNWKYDPRFEKEQRKLKCEHHATSIISSVHQIYDDEHFWCWNYFTFKYTTHLLELLMSNTGAIHELQFLDWNWEGKMEWVNSRKLIIPLLSERGKLREVIDHNVNELYTDAIQSIEKWYEGSNRLFSRPLLFYRWRINWRHLSEQYFILSFEVYFRR